MHAREMNQDGALRLDDGIVREPISLLTELSARTQWRRITRKEASDGFNAPQPVKKDHVGGMDPRYALTIYQAVIPRGLMACPGEVQP